MDKIICVGKNYREHAKELGDAVPEKPVLFLKPPSVLREARENGALVQLSYLDGVGSLHHECEIVLRIDTLGSRGGFRLSLADAQKAIGAVTLGLDMTLRDRQALLKKQGHPWETAKVFPDSAVVGPWKTVHEFTGWRDTAFSFSIDGSVRQKGTAGEMSFGPAECVAYASEYFPLREGDLLFTGTPAGVGAVLPGQTAALQWGPIAYRVTWK